MAEISLHVYKKKMLLGFLYEKKELVSCCLIHIFISNSRYPGAAGNCDI
jgi:hypothetical protein